MGRGFTLALLDVCPYKHLNTFVMELKQFTLWISRIPYGKKLPEALYISRPADWHTVPPDLASLIGRAIIAAKPNSDWNLLKLHTDQVAISFLTYPDFDSDPHPALAESVKINMNSGAISKTDYRKRANPPILHRKEAFIPSDDPRFPVFTSLTNQEEEAGILRDISRIGLRTHWETLLKRSGLSYKGHQLVRNNEKAVSPTCPNDAHVERHRTAIKRYDLSRPIKLALERGLIRKSHTLFDYGCGHGMDVDALRGLGYSISGWDPAFRPKVLKTEADIVNLGYVLNVIESPEERIDAIKGAFSLARKALIVSVMAEGRQTQSHTYVCGDGFITRNNTFQKFYAPGELEQFLETHLQAEVITLTLGICVAFRDLDEVEAFEACRSRRRIDWLDLSSQLQFPSPTLREQRRADRYDLHQELFDSYWDCLLEYGRTPELGEFDRLAEVRKAGGGLTRALKLVVEKRGEAIWQHARKSRSEDVLVYLAMTHFRKKFLPREVPLRIKNDIRAFFGDIATARKRGLDILHAAADTDEVGIAVEGLKFGVYDRIEKHFTFHRSFLNQLPPVLRVYILCGAIRYGDPEEADLIKIHVASGKLTFLHYDDFKKARPVLQTRIKINLRDQFVHVFDHRAEKQVLADKDRYMPPLG
jgi:DNA phosphorothioation-associated putative methyltransferase